MTGRQSHAVSLNQCSDESLKKLRRIARKRGWDEIESDMNGFLDGRYQ